MVQQRPVPSSPHPHIRAGPHPAAVSWKAMDRQVWRPISASREPKAPSSGCLSVRFQQRLPAHSLGEEWKAAVWMHSQSKACEFSPTQVSGQSTPGSQTWQPSQPWHRCPGGQSLPAEASREPHPPPYPGREQSSNSQNATSASEPGACPLPPPSRSRNSWASSSRRFQLNTLAAQRVSDRIEDDLCWVWRQAQWGAQGPASCRPSPALRDRVPTSKLFTVPPVPAGRIGLGASLHFST